MTDALQTTPTYYEPDAVKSDNEQHKLRVLIDEVATSRGLTIQMSLRLMSIVAASDEQKCVKIRSEFSSMANQFCENVDLVFGSNQHPDVNQDHVDWIREIAVTNPQRKQAVMGVRSEVVAMDDFLNGSTKLTFDQAQAFFEANWPIVRDEMTTMIWDLWADLDAQKTEALSDIKELQKALNSTLGDIKKFSTEVRMVALNTSVLASRPADAGAGFKVIATEVKRLAEEIQTSTDNAEQFVSNMNQRH